MYTFFNYSSPHTALMSDRRRGGEQQVLENGKGEGGVTTKSGRTQNHEMVRNKVNFISTKYTHRTHALPIQLILS